MEEYVNLCPHETNISESAKDFDINWRRIAPIFPEGSLATLLLLPEKSEPAKELRDDFIIVGWNDTIWSNPGSAAIISIILLSIYSSWSVTDNTKIFPICPPSYI
ncbi:hypothetical protein [Hungatella effluvii]|uniref:hypothetical protein n=1 Tax=Hungatella effluvii TaxID=1096246 RepID=UPI002A83A578|nr:hypothetical protein [Hungatella effluvii]